MQLPGVINPHGGQWEKVFVEQPYLPDGPSVAYFRWLYTAITRAKEQLYLIGFGKRILSSRGLKSP